MSSIIYLDEGGERMPLCRDCCFLGRPANRAERRERGERGKGHLYLTESLPVQS